jgi:hypothetical protein
LLSLVQGGMRAVTGLIGKNSPTNVSYRAATATIGIRGTDVNIATNGKDVLVSVNDGVITFSYQGQTITIPAGQAGRLLDGTVTQADKNAILRQALSERDRALAAALAAVSTEALTAAVNRANTGPVSGDSPPQSGSQQVGTSTITNAGSGGGGSTSPSKP